VGILYTAKLNKKITDASGNEVGALMLKCVRSAVDVLKIEVEVNGCYVPLVRGRGIGMSLSP
jgi:hypothetical protein